MRVAGARRPETQRPERTCARKHSRRHQSHSPKTFWSTSQAVTVDMRPLKPRLAHPPVTNPGAKHSLGGPRLTHLPATSVACIVAAPAILYCKQNCLHSSAFLSLHTRLPLDIGQFVDVTIRLVDGHDGGPIVRRGQACGHSRRRPRWRRRRRRGRRRRLCHERYGLCALLL